MTDHSHHTSDYSAPRSRAVVRYAPLWVSIAAAAIISMVCWLLVDSISELRRTRSMVDHTHRVLSTLDGVLIDIEQAETRQRGFVITGNRAFLGRNSTRREADSSLTALRELVRDNAVQRQSLDDLASVTGRRLDLIDSTLAVRDRDGFAAAAAIIASGRGAATMDTVRSIIARMKQREQWLLQDRTEDERVSLRRSIIAGALGIGIAIILFGVAILLIRRTLRALAAGRRSAMQAAALLQSTSDGIYGLDHSGRIVFANRSMAKSLGYTEAEMVGQAAHPLIHHTRPDGSPYPADECPMSALLRNQGEGRFENEIIWRKDGTSIPVEYLANPIRGSRRMAYVVSFRDITDRQRVDAALREGKLAAEAANRAKSDFLARMSHELRTPLNSVIGFANVLLRNKAENLRPQDLTYIERIQKNGVSLLGLINDILDLSKIESGHVEVERAPLLLQELVGDVRAQFETQVAARGIELVTIVPDDLAPIESDRGKLEQILRNLIANAIKFTERGQVRVQVTVDPETRLPLSLSVTDSGIGIPASRLEAIFDPFEQAEKSTTRKYGGTGLGLPISRSLAQLLGYTLRVESVEGRGSTFTLDMSPRDRAPADAQDVLPPVSETASGEGILLGRLALIIDDDSDSRTLIAHQIAALGGRSAGAATGQDGLRMARELKPDLITLDLLLPGMDGHEILHLLKSDPELASIPVIVVSMVGRELSAGLAGSVTALSKPLDRGALTNALRHAIGLGRVLVVDDDPDTQHLLADYLFEAGAAEVRVVSGGRSAVAVIDEFQPDLVLLDLVMPNGNGEAVLEALARRPDDAKPCPVIVVTSKELSPGEARQLELVTLGVLRKGAALEETLRAALTQFQQQRRRPSPPRGSGAISG